MDFLDFLDFLVEFSDQISARFDDDFSNKFCKGFPIKFQPDLMNDLISQMSFDD